MSMYRKAWIDGYNTAYRNLEITRDEAELKFKKDSTETYNILFVKN